MIAPIQTITPQEAPALDSRTRVLLLAVRRALIVVLIELENYLGVERSVYTKKERETCR